MKKWLFLFIFMSLGSLPAKALDIPTDCSDLEMLNQKWKSQYYHDLKFDTYLFNPPELTCDSHLYQFVKAVWVIENAKAPRVGHYYETMKKVISQIRFAKEQDINDETGDVDTDTCGQADHTNVVGQIILYPCFFDRFKPKNKTNYNSNLLERVAMLIHETRHLQKGDRTLHIACKTGAYICDEQYTDDLELANAYSFEIIYLKDIEYNNNFSVDTQKVIENLIKGRLNNNFLNDTTSIRYLKHEVLK